MQDLSDVEWLATLRGVYGEKAISIGPPQAAVGKPARYWNERGMSGVYLDKDLICPPKQHNGQAPAAYCGK